VRREGENAVLLVAHNFGGAEPVAAAVPGLGRLSPDAYFGIDPAPLRCGAKPSCSTALKRIPAAPSCSADDGGTMRKYTACVITHGHLDVEWYQPLKSFAFWTAQALERLMAQEDPAPYGLDGQVFPLEEYLENMRPDTRGALEALIRRGALKIGPFYTQFDEWIPDPEAMVRNCLWGCLRGERMGGAMRVGYLPDNFGHPTQLPQILRGFGIDSLLFMRGMPYIEEDFPDEFTLAGPDGSTLRATHFRDGYSRIYGKGIENFAEDFLPQFRPAPYYDDYISYEHYLEMTVIDDPDRHAREMIAYVQKTGAHFPSRVIRSCWAAITRRPTRAWRRPWRAPMPFRTRSSLKSATPRPTAKRRARAKRPCRKSAAN
jgi:hypothetical protein